MDGGGQLAERAKSHLAIRWLRFQDLEQLGQQVPELIHRPRSQPLAQPGFEVAEYGETGQDRKVTVDTAEPNELGSTIGRIGDALQPSHPDQVVDELADGLLAHHSYLPGAIERYPDAKVWGASGLCTKRRDVEFDATLATDEAPWTEAFEPMLLQGNAWLSEVVFLHRASRTLVVTDLVFNIHEVGNLWTKWTLRSAGAFGKLAQSKLWRFTTKDRAAMQRSIESMLR